MLIYAIAIVLALLIVPLTDGRYRQLAEVELSRAWLLFVGLGLQIGLDVVDLPRARFDDLGLALLLLSYACILGFAVSNLGLRGMGVIAIGISMNALVIALNLGMPYTIPPGTTAEVTVKHRPEKPGDILPVLSDRIAMGRPFEGSMSFGDLVIGVGLIDLCFHASRRPRRSRARFAHPSESVDVDLVREHRADREQALAEHHALEGVEDPRVVDVTRS